MIGMRAINFWENEVFPTKWLRPDVGFIKSDALLGLNNIHYCPTSCGLDNKPKKKHEMKYASSLGFLIMIYFSPLKYGHDNSPLLF
jgi:hypothetical protein